MAASAAIDKAAPFRLFMPRRVRVMHGVHRIDAFPRRDARASLRVDASNRPMASRAE
jgi:hypothetical protein